MSTSTLTITHFPNTNIHEWESVSKLTNSNSSPLPTTTHNNNNSNNNNNQNENNVSHSLVTDEDISKVMNCLAEYPSVIKKEELKAIQAKVSQLYSKDYTISKIKNRQGEICATYPPDLIVIEGDKHYVSDPNIEPSKLNDAKRLESLFHNGRFARVRARFPIGVILWEGKNICRSSTLSQKIEFIAQSVHNQVKNKLFYDYEGEYSPPTTYGFLPPPPKTKKSNELLNSVNNNVNSNSNGNSNSNNNNGNSNSNNSNSSNNINNNTSTLNTNNNEVVESNGQEASQEVPNKSQMDDLRTKDIAIIKELRVEYICDLMVENKKRKFGINICSSEKVDMHDRYSPFTIASMPYPGVEFFTEFANNKHCAVDLYFDWSKLEDAAILGVHSALPTGLNTPQPSPYASPTRKEREDGLLNGVWGTSEANTNAYNSGFLWSGATSGLWTSTNSNFVGVNGRRTNNSSSSGILLNSEGTPVPLDDYKNWDLISLTQNYLKLLLQFLCSTKEGSGILIHCISGWDRTPLFVALLRISLWADGEIHQGLDAREILYLTVAYDWLLFSHQFSDRASRGEDIFYFCFYFLEFIAGDEFSIQSIKQHALTFSKNPNNSSVTNQTPSSHTPNTTPPLHENGKKDVNNSTGFYHYIHSTTSPQSSNSVTPPPARSTPPSLLSQALASIQNTLLGASKDNEVNCNAQSPPLRGSSSAPPSPSLHNTTPVRKNNPLSLSSSEIATSISPSSYDIAVPVDVPEMQCSSHKKCVDSEDDVSCDSECGSWQMISESFGNKVPHSVIKSKLSGSPSSDEEDLLSKKNDRNKLTFLGNPPVLNLPHTHADSIHLQMDKSSSFLNITQTKGTTHSSLEDIDGVFPQLDDSEENPLKKLSELQNIQDANNESGVSFEEMSVSDSSRGECEGDDDDEEMMRIRSLSFTEFGSPQSRSLAKMNTPTTQKLASNDPPTVKIHAPIPTLPIYPNVELKNITNEIGTTPPIIAQHANTPYSLRKERLLTLRDLGLQFYNQHCIQAVNPSTLWNIMKLFH